MRQPGTERHTRNAAKSGREKSFSKHLSHKARTGCSESSANRHFPLPYVRTSHEDVRNIRAREEKNERAKDQKHRGKHDEGTIGVRDRPSEPLVHDTHADVLVACRILCGEALRNDVEPALCLGDGHAELEPAEREHDVLIAAGPKTGGRCTGKVRAERKISIQFEPGELPAKALGCDTDDGGWTPLNTDLHADYSGIATKALLPECVAENHDRWRARTLRFVRKDQPSESWLQSKR